MKTWILVILGLIAAFVVLDAIIPLKNCGAGNGLFKWWEPCPAAYGSSVEY